MRQRASGTCSIYVLRLKTDLEPYSVGPDRETTILGSIISILIIGTVPVPETVFVLLHLTHGYRESA